MAEQERVAIYREKGELAYWADMAILMERPRIAAEVREAHLAKRDIVSPDTHEFFIRAKALEDYVDGWMAARVADHPTWPWASLILGIGKENLPKVLGLIEKFGTWYDPGDPRIPPYIHRAPTLYIALVEGEPVDKVGVWVAGIERLTLPSKLWKYSGMAVDPKTGKAPKRAAGKKLDYNAKLRTMLYRLGGSLLKAGGVWYVFYTERHQEIVERSLARGVKILPTPRERMCPECQVVVKKKATEYCPTCGGPLTLKAEPEGVLWKGHVHLMALRETIKQWELCLWLVWREVLGLPVSQPYSVAFLDHKPIDPWVMVDRPVAARK